MKNIQLLYFQLSSIATESEIQPVPQDNNNKLFEPSDLSEGLESFFLYRCYVSISLFAFKTHLARRGGNDAQEKTPRKLLASLTDFTSMRKNKGQSLYNLSTISRGQKTAK